MDFEKRIVLRKSFGERQSCATNKALLGVLEVVVNVFASRGSV